MAKKTTSKKKTTASKKTASKNKAAAKPTETLLVASKVKEVIKKYDCNTAGDALDGLNGWMYWLIDQACKRAAANGRKTVRAHDFIIP